MARLGGGALLPFRKDRESVLTQDRADAVGTERAHRRSARRMIGAGVLVAIADAALVTSKNPALDAGSRPQADL